MLSKPIALAVVGVPTIGAIAAFNGIAAIVAFVVVGAIGAFLLGAFHLSATRPSYQNRQ